MCRTAQWQAEHEPLDGAEEDFSLFERLHQPFLLWWGNPEQAFLDARQLMLAGDYDAAEGAFAAYVQAYPDATKAPEANYWLGKTLSVRGDHTRAAQAYIADVTPPPIKDELVAQADAKAAATAFKPITTASQ